MMVLVKKIMIALMSFMMFFSVMPASAVAEENSAAESPWEGRTAVFVGDSITAGSGTDKIYYQYLKESLKLGSVTAMGVGGSCFSAASDYGKNNQPLINRYQTIPSADLIVIFMGTNDYGHETPLGSISDTQDGTFYGALNVIVPALVDQHPSSKIVFVTPIHRYGFGTSKILGTKFTYDHLPNGVDAALEDYVNALKDVCAKHDVSVIDLYTECTLDPTQEEVRSSYMPDGIHPNAAGHEVIAGHMYAHLMEYEPIEEAPVVLNELIQGNKFASSHNQSCRASSRLNYYLEQGTVITLKQPDVMQWACAKTSSETSTSNLGYFPESQWTDMTTAVVQEDGWIGFTFKYRDETQSFDLSMPLSDLIEIHTHTKVIDAQVDATCTEPGLTEGLHCETCGEVFVKQEIIPASGHHYEQGICTGCNKKQWDTDGDGTLEILAIGNSFSVDALEYGYQIAQSLGIEKVVLGNLYIGGCTLATHAVNAAGDLAKYTYYYNDSGKWTATSEYKISTALESRSWDYVSLQQGSPMSGVESSYNEDLTKLIAYVQNRSDAKLAWHMTWAYQQNSTHSAFPTYNKDQMTMYNAIVSAVTHKILTNEDIDYVIPSGTAVQNARTSLLGDTMTRDGYHMSYDTGRYLTGLMFMKTLTGLSVDQIAYAASGVDAEEKAIAIESVNNAFELPFEVTKSKYTTEIPEGYLLLQPELYKGAFWHSTYADGYNILQDDKSNSHQFYATPRFTKEQLPVGSILVVENGWQYRPEGWITDALQTNREDTTSKTFVKVTEDWWNQYTLRAFNLSKTGLPSLKDVEESEVRESFKIYVPEDQHVHMYENGICTLCKEMHPGPVLIQQPSDDEVSLGERFCVEVKAEGEGLKYQWYFRNAGASKWSKSGVKDNTYDDVMTKARANREVYCVITDVNGNTVTTEIAKLICIPSIKLEITKQPVDAEAVLGDSYCISVEAQGEGLKYQWYFRNAGASKWSKSGVKDNTYDDVMTKARANREVYCVITDVNGNAVTTEIAKLICIPSIKLEITKQPVDAEAVLGDSYCISVEAQGEGLKYQWFFRNAGSESWSKSGVKDNTYDDVLTKTRVNREVYCVITDAYGNSVTSDSAKIIRIPETLEILAQPNDASAAFGELFCAKVEAKGEGLKYQWYYRNQGTKTWRKSGVKDNTYDDVMTTARNGREVYCVITDEYGNSVTTDTAILKAVPKTELKLLSQSYESAELGERFCASVEAEGDGLKYQWYFRNAGSTKWNKSSVKDSTYDDVMTKARKNREVYCVITDAFGNQVTSEVMTLHLK